MKKINIFVLIILVFVAIFTSCNSPQKNSIDSSNTNLTENYINLDDFITPIEPMNSIEKVMEWSDCIVKATFISDVSVSKYSHHQTFEVEKTYYGVVDKEITVADSFYDGMYKSGHSYYLFLNVIDSVFNKEILYTTVVKSLIIDAAKISDSKATVSTKLFSVKICEIENLINNAIKDGKVASKVSANFQISDSTNLQQLAEESNAIVKVKIKSESSLAENSKISEYKLELVEIIKNENNIKIDYSKGNTLLPSELKNTVNYYLLLKTDNDGHYRIFSRNFPVVEATEENKKLMGIE